MVYLSCELKFLLSLLLGAFVGLERENYERRLGGSKEEKVGALGVRSFALVTALGCVAGLLRAQLFSLFLTINIAFMVLLMAYYVIGSFFRRDNGITTEIAIIFSYLIGVFVALEVFPIQLVLAITIILVLILSKKKEIKTLIAGMKTSEFSAFVSYAIIALVILPFLPNTSYSLQDIPGLGMVLCSYGINLGEMAQVGFFNPFKIWLVVALITGVDVVGYVLEKTIGQKKGWLLTSVIGGFISSTATTQSLAQQSRKSGTVNKLVAAAIFSSLASFFQIFILIASINSEFLVKSTVFFFSIVASAFFSGLFFLKAKDISRTENLEETKEKLKEKEIFALNPALKFALLFLLIKVVTKVFLVLFGNSGFLLASAVAGVAGTDAVVINTAELVKETVGFQTGILALILVNTVNLVSKTIYSFMQGKREFAVKLAISMGIIVASSFLSLLFV